MMFKIVISIGLLACYSTAKSVDLPNDNQIDLSTNKGGGAMEDSEAPDLSEVIREVENIQETFLRKLSEEMAKIDGKLQKIRDRHQEEMKHFEQEPVLGGEKKTLEQKEEDSRRGGKRVEPKLTETPEMPDDKKMGNLPNETLEIQKPEKVIIEVRVPEMEEFTKSGEKKPSEESQPDLDGVKEFREDFSSTTQKSLEQIVEEEKEKLEQLKTEDKLQESEEEKGEQESKETQEPVEKEKKMDSSSESSESSEEKPDLITAPSGSSIVISVPAELQEEGNVHVEVIPGDGKEFLNPQPEDLRLAEYSTESPSVSTETPVAEYTTEAPEAVFTTESLKQEITTEVSVEETTAQVTTESLKQEITTEVSVEETTAQVPREKFTTETPREETVKEESTTEGSKMLPPGNTIIVSLSTGPEQHEEKKKIVIDIELPKETTLDENVSSKTLPTEGRLPEPTTERPNPTKTTRRPEGKKRPSGKRCPIGYQLNIYTLECTIQANYATGFGSYYWSMSQSPSSLTQNNPFMNLFGLRK